MWTFADMPFLSPAKLEPSPYDSEQGEPGLERSLPRHFLAFADVGSPP